MAQQALSLGPLAPQRTALRSDVAGAAGSRRGSHPDVAAMARPRAGSRRQKHQRSRRPSNLPLLSLPKFLKWAPLRIIGLLRPKASQAREEPSLRELLLETQRREQEQLDKDTKERQRQLTMVVVVALLFTCYLMLTCVYLYNEWDGPTPVTPGTETVPLELLRSSVNGSNELDIPTEEP
ncbi:uncharacterized protein LOC144168001 [Haemaphysalis longicornis]